MRKMLRFIFTFFQVFDQKIPFGFKCCGHDYSGKWNDFGGLYLSYTNACTPAYFQGHTDERLILNNNSVENFDFCSMLFNIVTSCILIAVD